jgi:acetyl esterase/lipase
MQMDDINSSDQTSADTPVAVADGSIEVPAFRLPLSAALSETARQYQISRTKGSGAPPIPIPRYFDTEEAYAANVVAFREGLDLGLAKPWAEAILAKYPVGIESAEIGGVPVEIFTPAGGGVSDQIMINLHGGGFCSGAIHIGRVESIPVSYLGGWKVVSINYRQGFEHKFPAACEDVAAVYKELLKTYPPERIGLYGASAGGMLTGQAVAWFIEHGIPVPGAAGIFAAGGGQAGDADYFGAIATGTLPPSPLIGDIIGADIGYFSDVASDSYLVNPDLAPEEFRAKFPPTLLITGTRAFDLSPAIGTHRALVRAGVDASLHVFDGHGHSFFYLVDLPEAQDAYATIIRFFRWHLAGS